MRCIIYINVHMFFLSPFNDITCKMGHFVFSSFLFAKNFSYFQLKFIQHLYTNHMKIIYVQTFMSSFSLNIVMCLNLGNV